MVASKRAFHWQYYGVWKCSILNMLYFLFSFMAVLPIFVAIFFSLYIHCYWTWNGYSLVIESLFGSLWNWSGSERRNYGRQNITNISSNRLSKLICLAVREWCFFKWIQAKKFLKGDWLKRVVFQPNLKYLHVGISFPYESTRLCYHFENMVERFLEWEWMPFTWIPSQCPHFTGGSQLMKTA